MTLAAEGFDFRGSFPVPRDDERHRAGRQGVLDQKEDASMTDAQWVAFQHGAWCEELCAHHVERADVLACLAAGVDPDTGKPPRDPRAWPGVEARGRARAERLALAVLAMLEDYADHFGDNARDGFGAFVLAAAQECSDIGPPQGSLFPS